MIAKKFEDQVSINPNGLAVKFKDMELSYDLLNKNANRIARAIHVEFKNKKIVKYKNVVLLFDHGIDIIKAVIGAVKSATLYIPLEPSYPKSRLEYIIGDSEATIIVTNNANYELASSLAVDDSVSILNIDTLSPTISESNLELDISGNDMAYILYTSGSTGKPKGVVQSYKNIYHFATAYGERLSINKSDNITLFSAFSHDAAVVDIFGALLNGATLFPLNVREQIDIAELPNWLTNEKITIWHSVPTLYRYFINHLEETIFMDIRYIVLGGESVSLTDIEKYKKYFTQAEFVNLYGQTESSINSLMFINPEMDIKRITLGEVIKDTELLILDEEGYEAETLVVGEIAVCSNYLAIEYWKNQEKTEAVFMEDEELGRIYFTGDLGRYLNDGSIEILGRKDNQIKIWGYRVELGEIENKLQEHKKIKEAVVLAKEDSEGNKYLISFVVNDGLTEAEIREYLLKNLSHYMIPAKFIEIDELPLTTTGKVDRQALSEKEVEMAKEAINRKNYEAPRNILEEKLVQIWEEILAVSEIGINDSFFELGGHSLKATSLVSRIYKELSLEIPIQAIFKEPTIKGISKYLEEVEESIYSEIQAVEVSPYEDGISFDVSSSQRRMYALQQFDISSKAYNLPRVIQINGKLNIESLENAFKVLIQRHEPLRTSFKLIKGSIVQTIHKNVDFAIDKFSISKENNVENIINSFVRVFDINEAPLLRVGIIELWDDKNILMVDIHHIISDGVSTDILIREFVAIYAGNELSPLRIQYKDYSTYQKELLSSEKLKQQEQYWLDSFKDEVPVLNMPTDYPRPAIQSFEGNSIDFKLNKEITNKLRQIAKETGSTLYMVMLASLKILLSKYSGQEDIVVGSPIAGRPHPDLENLIGMFVNTLAMRSYPTNDKTVKEFIEEIKETALKAYENQFYQFEELVDKLDITRDLSRNPLFDVMFTLQNMSRSNVMLEGISVSNYEKAYKVSKLDLSLTAVEIQDYIELNIQYCTKLFKQETIERLYKHFENIIIQMTDGLNTKLGEISLTSEAEKLQIIKEFNNTDTDYSKCKAIHQLFEEKVKIHPDKIAVVHEDKYLTYKQLNEKANQLARILLEQEIGDNAVDYTSIIGLMVERSVEMLVGILAVLKVGGAYLPIDPEYPIDRINYMLKDSEAKTLLINSKLKDKIVFEGNTIIIDNEELYKGSNQNIDNVDVNAEKDLAYVIYTSGSTGNPKGVMIGHSSVNNFIKGMSDKINFSSDKKILALTTICFDIFGLETILPLTQGMEIVIAGEVLQRDSNKLIELIEEKQIDMLQATPSRMEMILESTKSQKTLASLKDIIIGGEAFTNTLVEKVRSKTTSKIYNVYGPTETTIWSTIKELKPQGDFNIGRPIANTKIYIVDKSNKLQPIGVSGELCIAGDGLAKGYLNRLELTTQKFVDNPFEVSSKMYKTGDLAKWLPDGSIEFVGRMDYQVKIRGYRIELREIEIKLLEEVNIKEAIVLVRERKGSHIKYLSAYLTGEAIDLQAVKTSLKKKLPEYMQPSTYIILEKMPQTANGKTNRKALLEIERQEDAKDKIPPRNYFESTIADIWQETLMIEEVYVNDDFFELGGNSINIIQVVSKIKEMLDIEVSPADLMVTKTIEELVTHIQDRNINTGSYKHIFKLNRSKSIKNIFIVHGGDADIFYYRHLAKLLEDEYSVYGIQPKGLKEGDSLPLSYYEMYHDYVKEIRMVQNEGPYILGGYCIGGYISFDISKILEIQGDKVEALLQLDQEAFVEPKMHKLIMLNDFIFRTIDLWRRIANKDKAYTTEKMMKLYPKANPLPKEVKMELIKNKKSLQQYFQKNMPMESSYRFIAKSTIAPTLVIKAEHNNHRLLKKELWEKMTETSLKYYEIPGEHETVLLPPYIERMADIIKEYLRKRV